MDARRLARVLELVTRDEKELLSLLKTYAH
jgi:hypothetical protein